MYVAIVVDFYTLHYICLLFRKVSELHTLSDKLLIVDIDQCNDEMCANRQRVVVCVSIRIEGFERNNYNDLLDLNLTQMICILIYASLMLYGKI